MVKLAQNVANMQEVCHNIPMGDKFGDMYKQYIKDGEQAEVVEFEYGFLVLKYEGPYLYIETIYVAPEVRKTGYGREMLEYAEERVLSEGLMGVLGSCSPGRKGATISMKSMLACGFELLSSDKDIIYLVKYLKPKGA